MSRSEIAPPRGERSKMEDKQRIFELMRGKLPCRISSVLLLEIAELIAESTRPVVEHDIDKAFKTLYAMSKKEFDRELEKHKDGDIARIMKCLLVPESRPVVEGEVPVPELKPVEYDAMKMQKDSAEWRRRNL